MPIQVTVVMLEMVEMVEKEDVPVEVVEIIVEVDVRVAIMEMVVVLEEDRHSMLEGVMVDNLTIIVTNFLYSLWEI